jgi:cytidyltransferase-like protein
MNKINGKRIMVDMSATLIHHGHVRLLKKASKYGKVIVALVTDKEIKKFKGYKPELNYSQRKEIMQSIRYVSKVVPSKFILNDKFLNKFKINLLIHGQDNNNQINKKFLLIIKRTKNISSAILRKRAVKALRQMN